MKTNLIQVFSDVAALLSFNPQVGQELTASCKFSCVTRYILLAFVVPNHCFQFK